jgi:hypothetical protein
MKTPHAVLNRLFIVPLALFLGLTTGSCSPKFYKVDQQTVLEDEAAGEWPEFEKEILSKTQSSVPKPFPTVATSARKARLFNVLNTTASEPLAAPAANPGKAR